MKKYNPILYIIVLFSYILVSIAKPVAAIPLNTSYSCDIQLRTNQGYSVLKECIVNYDIPEIRHSRITNSEGMFVRNSSSGTLLFTGYNALISVFCVSLYSNSTIKHFLTNMSNSQEMTRFRKTIQLRN